MRTDTRSSRRKAASGDPASKLNGRSAIDVASLEDRRLRLELERKAREPGPSAGARAACTPQ
ncbi:MAG: hypothetical protein MZV70_50330 [Desulfobacterales bacterium]|nr:hypothetical protein [Desulfobacterales bacterium]